MKNPTYSNDRRSVMIAMAGAAAAVMSPASEATPSAPANDRPLRGQAALVTGAARGIGRAVAVSLARAGARLCLFDIARDIESVDYPLGTLSELESTLTAVRDLGSEAFIHVGDVRDRAALQSAAAAMLSRFGRIDIAIPNAGILTMGRLTDLSAPAWDDVIAVNLTGVANTMAAVLPAMRKAGYGRIVVTASCNGRAGSAGSPSYNASKWGVIGLVKSVAAEEARSGITVNCVNPTGVATAMTQQARYVDGFRDFLRGFNAQARDFLTPEEIADAMIFFVRPEAAVITGEALDVAAGANIRWGA